VRKTLAILLVMAACGGLPSVYSNCSTNCVNVLFMGNSLTHGNSGTVTAYNNANVHDFNGSAMGGVPGIFQKLASDGGWNNLAVNIEAVSAVTLAYHLANKAGVITNSGAYGPWDWIVLQDFSTRPTAIPGAGDVAGFRSNVQNLNGLATNSNPSVKTLLFGTWARPDIVAAGSYPNIQSMQTDLTTNYSNAARDFNLIGYAPVGDAFLASVASGLSINPNVTSTPGPGQIDLWQFDNWHASTEGSYLAALVFYAKILGGDPRSLPTGPGSAASDLGLNPMIVPRLQNIAYEMVFGSTNTTPDFVLAIEPTTQSIVVGSNTTCTVSVGAVNGFTHEVTLSITGLPTGVSADFNPPTITSSGTATMSISVAPETPAGSYSFTVVGTDSNTTHTINVGLTINLPDFVLVVAPGAQIVTGGSNPVYTVNISPMNGFSGNVALSVTGVPAGVTATFHPPTIIGSGSANLLLNTSTNVLDGTYSLTVIGTGDTTSHVAVAMLTVLTAEHTNGAIPDWWTQQYFGSPLTNELSCATCDADGTGQNNLFKYIAGLDPTNPASGFVVSLINTDNLPNLMFSPIATGRTYRVQFTTNLTLNAWLPLTDGIGPLTNGDQVTIVDTGFAEPQKHYRIRISMP
jgi:hypothetical protein